MYDNSYTNRIVDSIEIELIRNMLFLKIFVVKSAQRNIKTVLRYDFLQEYQKNKNSIFSMEKANISQLRNVEEQLLTDKLKHMGT
jgi:hypothetical protein